MEHQQTDGTSTDWNITRQRSVLNNIYKHTTTPQLVPPPFLTLIIPLTTCLHSTQPNFTNSVVNPLSPSLSYIRRQWYNFTSGNGRVSRLILPNGVRWTYTERLKEVCFFLPCVSLFVELRYGKSGRGLWEPIATDWIRLALAQSLWRLYCYIGGLWGLWNLQNRSQNMSSTRVAALLLGVYVSWTTATRDGGLDCNKCELVPCRLDDK